jgi:muramidase (phage lysozyme)
MPVTAPDFIGGRNVAAFLDMLAHSEGTDNGRQRTKCVGYDVLVGGGLFTDFTRHPGRLVRLSPSLSSTAAGRYQFLRRTWSEVAALLKLADFMPASQDVACVQLLKRRRAFELVQVGRFDEAVRACAKEWASLPGAGYGQHEQKLERLRKAYTDAGGLIGEWG